MTLSTDDVVLCGDETAELIPIVEGGVGDYIYEWSTDENTPTITVDGNGSTEFTITVDDECVETPPLTEVINLESNDVPELSFPPGSIEYTCEESVEVEVVVSGLYESIIFAEDDGDVFGVANPATYATELGADYIVVTIIDACDQVAEIEIPIVVNTPEPLSVSIGADINASCVDVNNLEAVINGGGSPFYYSWVMDGVEQSDELTFSVQLNETNTVVFDVMDGCGNEATDQLVINIPNNPMSIITSEDLLVCPNVDVQISAMAEGGEEGFTYTWSSLGLGAVQDFTATQTTSYTVTANDICGHSVSGSVNVNVIPFNVTHAFSNPIENDYSFQSITTPACTEECIYFWDFGDDSSSEMPNPNHIYDGTGIYQGFLAVTNSEGCIDTSHFSIFPPITIFVPNAFTPNNDGINDVFRVYGIGVVEYDIKIFSRWGTLVYHSTDIDDVWLGELSSKNYYTQNDSYNFVINAKGYEAQTWEKKGTLSVIR